MKHSHALAIGDTCPHPYKWRHVYYERYVMGLESGALKPEQFIASLVNIGFTNDEAELEYLERKGLL